MMINLDFVLGPACDVVIAGGDDQNTRALIKSVHEVYLPNKVLLFRPLFEEQYQEITDIAGFIKEYKGLNGQAAAYVCINSTCHKPLTSPKALRELIERINGH
jgi:uncharacterized protein YyaL (SSP411 family)